jgi:hypothetical protein
LDKLLKDYRKLTPFIHIACYWINIKDKAPFIRYIYAIKILDTLPQFKLTAEDLRYSTLFIFYPFRLYLIIYDSLLD